MTNKVVGYMIAVPAILFFLFFFVAVAMPSVAAAIDMQIYVVIGIVFFVGLIVSLFKLWRLPEPNKKYLPISNKWIVGWMLIIFLVSALGEGMELGSQLETLVGLFMFILIGGICFRLITSGTAQKSNTEVKPANQEHEGIS